MNNNITIIGAGWLGLPLAKALKDAGKKVLVTATTDDKVAALSASGLHAVRYRAGSEAGDGNEEIRQQVFCCDTLIVCIPPKIRTGQTDYPKIIAALVADAKSVAQVSQLILCSSTAVYNGLKGTVDEASEIDRANEKAAILADAEHQVLASGLNRPQVLRLGGLIGPERHPGRFFRDSRVIPNPDSRINFIHQADVIAIIEYVIDIEVKKGFNIINAVAPLHPTRRQFYQRAHQVLNRPDPEFAEQAEINGKVVESGVLANLGYAFQYADMLQWLEVSE